MGCNKSDVVCLFFGLPMPATREQLTDGGDLCRRIFHAGLSAKDIIQDGDKYWLNSELLGPEIKEAEQELAKHQKRVSYLHEMRTALGARS